MRPMQMSLREITTRWHTQLNSSDESVPEVEISVIIDDTSARILM